MSVNILHSVMFAMILHLFVFVSLSLSLSLYKGDDEEEELDDEEPQLDLIRVQHSTPINRIRVSL